MARIVGDLGQPAIGDREALRQELRDVAEDFLTVALTTPLGITVGPDDVSLSKRATWVERHLFNPAHELLEALEDRNAPLRSGWPDLLDVEGPDRLVLIRELEKLRKYSKYLSWNLRERSETTESARPDRSHSRGANHTQEFLEELAGILLSVFEKYYHHIPINRGSSHADHGTNGKFRSFMDTCLREIAQYHITDDRLRKLFRANSNKGESSAT